MYQLIEQYYPAFVEHLAARERTLPAIYRAIASQSIKATGYRRV